MENGVRATYTLASGADTRGSGARCALSFRRAWRGILRQGQWVARGPRNRDSPAPYLCAPNVLSDPPPLRVGRRVVPFRLRPLSITDRGRLTYPRCGALPPALRSLPGACAAYAKNGQAVGCAEPALRILHASKDAETPSGTFAGGSMWDRRRRRSLFAIKAPIGAYHAWMTRTGDSGGGRCGRRGLPHAGGARRRRHCLTKSFQGLVIYYVCVLVSVWCLNMQSYIIPLHDTRIQPRH